MYPSASRAAGVFARSPCSRTPSIKARVSSTRPAANIRSTRVLILRKSSARSGSSPILRARTPASGSRPPSCIRERGCRARIETSRARIIFCVSRGWMRQAACESSRRSIRCKNSRPRFSARCLNRARKASDRAGPRKSPRSRARRYRPVPPTTIGSFRRAWMEARTCLASRM